MNDANKIGSVAIIWFANKEGVTQLSSIGAELGMGLREVISTTMGKDGPATDLIRSRKTISLSPVKKVWCETTPIYKDHKGGGVYVLFEKLDDDTCKQRGLEFIGTIDAKSYAVALCAANGLDAKLLEYDQGPQVRLGIGKRVM